MKNAGNFDSLDGLRAWMAWWVVAGHAVQLAGAPRWMPEAMVRMVNRTDVPVSIFIVLSGFVITHMLLNSSATYGQYIVRRAFRLYPIYLLCIALAVAASVPYHYTFLELPFATLQETRQARLDSVDQNFWAHMLAHLTLLHGAVPESWLPHAGGAFLAPAWSLSLEWQFYIVAPALFVLLMRDRRFTWFALAVLVGVGIACRKAGAAEFEYPSFLPMSIGFFAVGIGARYALERAPSTLAERGVAIAALVAFAASAPLVAAICALWALFVLLDQGRSVQGGSFVVSLRRLIAANRILMSLGRWSYSTYLVHIPVLAVVIWAGVRLLGFSEARTSVQQLTAVAMLLLPPLSYLLFRFVEQPGIAAGRHLSALLTPRRAVA